MEPSFRASMNWLHTWAGVVLGDLLFAIFWKGSLSVFDREIDRWMAPMTRLAISETDISFYVLRPSYEAGAKAKSLTWSVILPTEPMLVMRVTYRDGLSIVRQTIDVSTSVVLPDSGT